MLKLETDMHLNGRKKHSGTGTSKGGKAGTSEDVKADIGQKVQIDDNPDFPVFLFIRPEKIKAISYPESDSSVISDTKHTVLQISMLEAAEVICPHNTDLSLLRSESINRLNWFRSLASATEFSVRFNRGDKAREDDINYLQYIFSPQYEGHRPCTDERRWNPATLYHGTGGRIMKAEKDKSVAANPSPYTKKHAPSKFFSKL